MLARQALYQWATCLAQSQLLGGLRQEDLLSSGVGGQLGQNSEANEAPSHTQN
jgi:hypothetical protein